MTISNETTQVQPQAQSSDERAASCCSSAKQAVCCEPEDKASCCGAARKDSTSRPGSCGCQA